MIDAEGIVTTLASDDADAVIVHKDGSYEPLHKQNHSDYSHHLRVTGGQKPSYSRVAYHGAA